MMQTAGALFGYLLSIYYVMFRLEAVQAKYGRLDLILWSWYLVFAWSLAGWIVDLAIWGVQYAISTIQYGVDD